MPNDECFRKVSDPVVHERVGFRETTVRELVKSGALKGVRVRGVLMIPESAIDDFQAKAKRGELAEHRARARATDAATRRLRPTLAATSPTKQ